MKVFQRKQMIFGELLILFLVFSCSKSKSFDITGKRTYSLQVSEGYKYVKLEIQGDSDNTNYVLSVYSDQYKTRVQLAQSLNGKTLLYHQLKKNDKYIYYSIECDKVSCSGDLSSEFLNKISLSEGDMFSYYISGSQSWEFSINSGSSKTNIWARGQKKN